MFSEIYQISDKKREFQVIFDSPKMSELRAKFVNIRDYKSPEIVLLDRAPRLQAERDYIEAQIQLVTVK